MSYYQHHYKQDYYIIFAKHPDYAFGWAKVPLDTKEFKGFNIILTAPKTRSLKVVDDEGHPVENAKVWVNFAGYYKDKNPIFRDYIYLRSFSELTLEMTDKNGHVTIQNTPNTRLEYRIEKPGFVSTFSDHENITITLEKGVSISGVLQDDYGKPVEGETVLLYSSSANQSYFARSDKDGRYLFTDLPTNGWDMSNFRKRKVCDGKFTITLKSDQYTIIQDSIVLELNNDISDLNLSITSGTLVNCTVVDPATLHPVHGARIQGYSNSGRVDEFTNINGEVSFLVASGDVTLFYVSPSEGTFIYEDDIDLKKQHLTFKSSGPEMYIELTAPPVGGVIRKVKGLVKIPDGVSYSSINIYISADGNIKTPNQTGGYSSESGVNKDGSFSFERVPTNMDIYFYAVNKDRSYAGSLKVVLEEEVTENISVEMVETQKTTLEIETDKFEISPQRTLQIIPYFGDAKLTRAKFDVKPDKKGIFHMDGILPGQTYWVCDLVPGNENMIISDPSHSVPMDYPPIAEELILVP